MTECELCGRPSSEVVPIMYEGVRMSSCDKCARLGTVIQRKVRKVVKPKRSRSGSSGGQTKSAVTFSFNSDSSTSSSTPQRKGRSDDRFLKSNYGSLIRVARQKMKLTLNELAHQIKESGSLVQAIESQRIQPTDVIVRKLERTLSINLKEDVDDDVTQTVKTYKKSPSDSRTIGDVVILSKNKKKNR